jgi:hypothetical protein
LLISETGEQSASAGRRERMIVVTFMVAGRELLKILPGYKRWAYDFMTIEELYGKRVIESLYSRGLVSLDAIAPAK